MKNKTPLFTKYKTFGHDYHYQQINKSNLLKFNPFLLARYQIQIRLVLDNLNKFNKSKCLKILDVGCGDGVLLYLLKQRLKSYKSSLCGLDSSKEALKIAKQKIPSGHFLNGDACNLKFPDNSFDVVISSDVIEHVKNQNKMLQEIKRVVKKNGFIVIGTPVKISKKPQDKYHFKELLPGELKSLVKKYFNSVKLIKSHPLFFYLLYKRPFNFFGKKLYFFQLLINFSTIVFNINPFLKIQKGENGCFSYMFLIGENKNGK